MKIPSRQEIEALARSAAAKYGLDPAMFIGQLAQESDSFAPDVLTGKRDSPRGARGIAQFMPKTAKEMGVDPLNIPQAIDGAARYMAGLVKQFGSEDLARQAYNWGMGNLAKHLKDPKAKPMPQETREYNAHIARRAPKDDMQIPVLGKTPTAQVLQMMTAAPRPASAAGSPGLFSAPSGGVAPAAVPALPAPGLFNAPSTSPTAPDMLFAEAAPTPSPLEDIIAQANEGAGRMFAQTPSFPDSFDGMIQQLLKRV